MGVAAPWHLLTLLFIVALVVGCIVLAVFLIVNTTRRDSHSIPTVTHQSGPTLTELADLHAKGALTDEEFTAAKRKALDL